MPDHALDRGSAHAVVVGGGISGLAAAHALLESGAPGARSVRVTVLEASGRVGGKLAGDEVGGAMVDVGAESVLARRPEAVELIRAAGLGEDLTYPVTTSAGLWIGDRIRPLPPTVMGVPVDLAAAAGVLGTDGTARAGQDRELPPPALDGDVAIGRFVAERMGRAVTDRLVDPLLGGVYAGRADEISLAAAVPELFARLHDAPSLIAAAEQLRAAGQQAADQRSGADGSSSRDPAGSAVPPVFAGVRGGVHRMAPALRDELERRGVEVRTGCTVRGITRDGGGFVLETGPVPAPERITADAVVVAAPARPAARMLDGLAPAASAELGAIEYASLAIVTLAVRRTDWPVTTGSGFLVPAVEGRVIKASTYSHAKWDWTAEAGGELAIFRTSVGRLGEEQVLQRDDADLVAASAADLREAIGLDGEIVDGTVTRWGGALPQYAVGHLDRVDRIERAVAAVPGLAVCGAAYRGVGIAACVASGRQAATRVREHLDRLARMAP
jgi:oxygen-dependent protoporphyrinogen oxidase